MNLAIPSFVIAVVSITLQLFDAFPQHREARQAVVFITIGLFIGTAASVLAGARYDISGTISPSFAALYGIITFAAAFSLLAVLLDDPAKRGIAAGVAACFGCGALALGFGIGLGSMPHEPAVSFDDRLVLASAAEAKGDWSSAIEQLSEADLSIENNALRAVIEKRLAHDRASQANQVGR